MDLELEEGCYELEAEEDDWMGECVKRSRMPTEVKHDGIGFAKQEDGDD